MERITFTAEQIDALAERKWSTNEDDADIQFDDPLLEDLAGVGETHGGGPSLVDTTVALAQEVRDLRRQADESRVNAYGGHGS
jgi:hypothetical protein